MDLFFFDINLKLKNMKVSLELFKKFVEDNQKTKDACYEALGKIRDAELNKLIEITDLKGKFIKIHSDDIYFQYLFVENVSYNKTHERITLNGLGFSGEFSEYKDDNFAHWSWYAEHEIYVSGGWNIDEQFGKIEIITEEEYNKAFDDFLKEIRKNHNEIVEYLKENNEEEEDY